MREQAAADRGVRIVEQTQKRLPVSFTEFFVIHVPQAMPNFPIRQPGNFRRAKKNFLRRIPAFRERASD
jgi:hypothetical protein